MTIVKVCGLTNQADAQQAAEAGADMLGFIFAPVSKRYVRPEDARPIIDAIRSRPTVPVCVGVFVVDAAITPADIVAQSRISGVDAAQIVGANDPGFLAALNMPSYMCLRPETPIQAVEEAARFEPQYQPPWLPTLQLDAFHPALYGGTGQTAPKDVARQLVRKTPRLMLSGGLKADNVAEYVRDVQPWAVDVASGTELSPGHKDHQKVHSFIQAAKSALS